MALRATSRSLAGTLRQDVCVDGRFSLTTDEPTRLGGDDSAPSPHELVPAAIAACVATTLVMYARAREWDIGEVVVEVVYDQASTPRRCQVAIRVGVEVTAAQAARLEMVAATCPVRRALEGGVEFEEHLEVTVPRRAAAA